MSISSRITQIENHLKDDYEALENLGVSVEDRNIENIKDMANQIYNKFPKTSYAEGTEITLENTLKGKLDFENDIVGIGQISQESYEGYNIFNLTDYTNLVTTPNVSEVTITKTKDSIKIVTTNTSGLAGFYSTQTNANGWAAYVDNFNASNTYYLSYDIVATTNCQVKNGFEVAQHTDSLVANQKIRVTTSTSSGGSFICYSSSATTITITNIVISTNSSKTSYEPYVGGTASPNPSYPQEIEVVRGKNLLKPILNSGTASGITYTKNSDNSITLGGTSTGIFLVIIGYINAKKGTSYTISGGVSGNLQVQARVKNQSGTTRMASDGSVNQSYTAEIDETLAIIIRIPNGVQISETTIYPMLEKGSQATPYLPYNTIEATIRGKNRAKLDQSINNRNTDITYTENVANSVVGSKTSNNGQFLATFVAQVVSGQSYIISGTATNCNLYAYKETLGGEPFANISLSALPKSFQSDYTGTIVLGMFFPSATTGTASIKNFQLEEGSTATDYEPYQTPQTYQLSLGEYEFAKIGNYRDYIWTDRSTGKWYKHNEIIFKSLTTFNQIRRETIFGKSVQYINKQFNDIVTSNTQTYNFYAEMVSHVNGIANVYSGYLVNNNFVIIVDDNDTLETANNKFVGSKVCFQLKVPTDTEITDTTLINQLEEWYNSQSFTGTTIITSNGDLPLVLKVRGLKG